MNENNRRRNEQTKIAKAKNLALRKEREKLLRENETIIFKN